MGTPTAPPAPISPFPYYVWEVPDKVRIRLHFDVIDRILPEVMRGFGALPRRGAEVGGILLGRVLEREPLTISIEEFEPLACEYLTGPSFHLSTKDRERLETMLGLWQDRPLQVVGYFRSHTRKDLFLDERDQDVFQTYFPGLDKVVLLIKPFATRASVAGFFFRENGKLQGEATYSQFPFHRRELGGGDPRPPIHRQEGEPEAPQVPRQGPHPVPIAMPDPYRRPASAADRFLPDRFDDARTRPAESRPDLPPPPRREAGLEGERVPFSSSLDLPDDFQPSPLRRYMLLLAVLVVLVGAAAVGYQFLATPRPPAAIADLPLQLAVNQTGKQLDITWQRDSAVVASAQRGVLTITDGDHKEQLELTSAQLHVGRVIYTRVTRQVDVRLEIFTSDQSAVSESARVLAAEDPPPGAQAPPAQEIAADPPKEGETASKEPEPAKSEPSPAAPAETSASTAPLVQPAASTPPSPPVKAVASRPTTEGAKPTEPPKPEPKAQEPPTPVRRARARRVERPKPPPAKPPVARTKPAQTESKPVVEPPKVVETPKPPAAEPAPEPAPELARPARRR